MHFAFFAEKLARAPVGDFGYRSKRMDKLFRLELARTGTFGADGNSITKQDLKEVVETFDGHVPISLGHYMAKRDDWWPSWGNVDTIMMSEDPNGTDATLIGDISIREELADALKSGYYPGWSVSIPPRAADGKRYLHHLAFLGAVPPAIRDLKILGNGQDGMPDGAIKVDDLTAFGDEVISYFQFSDVASELKEIKDGKVVEEQQEGPEQKEVKKEGTDFSDTIVTKARKVLEGSVRTRVRDRLKGLLPENRMKLADDFCDLALDGYDFSDAEQDEPAVIRLFLDIADAIAKKPAKPKPGRMDFSDIAEKGDSQNKTEDAAKLAAIF